MYPYAPVAADPVNRYQSDQFVNRLGEINRRMDEIRSHAQNRLMELEHRRASTPPPRMGSVSPTRYSGHFTPPPRSQTHQGNMNMMGRPSNSMAGGMGGSMGGGMAGGMGRNNNMMGYNNGPQLSNSKAVLIGINYEGTQHELAGCANDARALEGLLKSQGWNPGHIRVITDENRRGPQPTYHTILQSLRWLIEGARPGDSLFFSFSGHGKQIRDISGEESDGMDECLLTADGAAIKDDDLYRLLVEPLPYGCRLTVLIDACHSGTVLDLPYSFGLRGDRKAEGGRGTGEGLVVMLSGCQDSQQTADIDYGEFSSQTGGACTTTMLQIIARSDTSSLTWRKLLEEMHFQMAQRGFPQRPVLSSNSPNFDPEYPVSFGMDNSPLRPKPRRTMTMNHPNAPRMSQQQQQGYGPSTPPQQRYGQQSSPYGTPYSNASMGSPASSGYSSPGYSTGSSMYGSPYDRRFGTRPALPSTSPTGPARIRTRNWQDMAGGDFGGFGGDSPYGNYMDAAGQAFMNDGKIGIDDAPMFAETALQGTPWGLAAGQFNDMYGQEGTGWGGAGNAVDSWVDGYTGNDAYGNAAQAAVGGFGDDWKFGAQDFQNVGSAYQDGGGAWGNGLLGNVGEAYADDGQFGLDEMGDIYGGYQNGWW